MTKPLISIALATHNAGHYLKAQMASLQAQTYPDIEIVVSDDASTDGTYEWLCEQARLDSRVRVLPQLPRAGFNQNFLRCFRACNGDLISPCDQDDQWSADKTAKLATACPLGGIDQERRTVRDADSSPRSPRCPRALRRPTRWAP